MRFGFLLAAMGFAAALTGQALLADDIYVNNAVGDDTFNGRSASDATDQGGPLKTISRALRIAQPGDRIIVEKTDLPYRESLSIQGGQHSGTDVMPFTIFSDGAVLDGTSPIDGSSWQYVGKGVFRFQPRLRSFQQLYLDGKPAELVPAVVPYTVPELQPKQWALVDGVIYFQAEDGKIPGQYELRYCRYQTGITLYEVRNVVINGLTVQGFQLDGINAHDGVTGLDVKNCRLRGNGRSGFSVGGASRAQLSNSLLGGNGNAQVRTEGHALLRINDCRFLTSRYSGPAIVQSGGRVSVDDGQPSKAATLSGGE